ncbi:hypothetical protein DFQ28_003132 [Apophysomyces sp. BC1034]|nr:hypothetical protein DFQ30_003273 [Apophysomyces sp. BC1015]KAG0178113.1 hypothetical protein DFQ29_003929 [Apophysomyces sp. BC1021]KAG0189652.1 hypothetical protein DFQ28_003132 [Apophysomyces sp. BC1034]
MASSLGPESTPFKEGQTTLCSVKTDIVSEASSNSSPTTPSASANKMFHSYLNQPWAMNKLPHPSEPTAADEPNKARSNDNSTNFFAAKNDTSTESLCHDVYDFETPFPLQNELDSLLSLETKPDKAPRPTSLTLSTTSLPSPWPTDKTSSTLSWKTPSIWTDHPLVSPMGSDLSPVDQKRVDEQQRALESAFFSRRSMSFSGAAGSRQGPLFQKQARYRSNLPMMQEDYFGRLASEDPVPSSAPYPAGLAGTTQVTEDESNVVYSSAGSIWSPPTAQRTVSPDSAQWTPCSPMTLRGAYNTQHQQQQQQQRRFSLTESPPCSDYWTSLVMDGSNLQRSYEELTNGVGARRHSVAGPYLSQNGGNTHSITTAVDKSFGYLPEYTGGEDVYHRQRQQVLHKDLLEHIEEYFGGSRATSSNTGGADDPTCQNMGKGIPLHHFVDSNTVLYKVEFKAGRSEICYVMDGDRGTLQPKNGDLVIVEADRGRDLGTVVVDHLTAAEIAVMQNDAASQTVHDNDSSARSNAKELHVKCLYRIANPAEIATLTIKNQDEAKALAVCQSKIKQRELPMEVMNAEYQWDRRKLTFYFVAEQRIDFRELVRELFKIYKTRIWMCAVKSTNAIVH